MGGEGGHWGNDSEVWVGVHVQSSLEKTGLDEAMKKTVNNGDVWLDSKEEDAILIEKFVRSMVVKRSFVVSVSGMSDVAGHGNYFEDSFPLRFAVSQHTGQKKSKTKT